MKTLNKTTPYYSKVTACLAGAALSWTLASSANAAAPPQMFGVNLSGGEGGNMYSMSNTQTYSDGQLKRNYPRGRFGWDYNYPNQALFNYYRSKGITLVRLPIKWERIQHQLGATLDSTEMTRIDAAIECARVAGMQVLLDLHNYNKYSSYVSGTWTLTGVVNAQPNPAVTIDHFTNLWSQLAARYTNNSAIYGYDIMNEPGGSVVNWQPAAQAAVNAIRVHDKKHWVVVEGVNWAGAQSWVSTDPAKNNASLNISDSAGKLIYSAHSYWDRNYQNSANNEWKFDGVYASYAAENGHPDMGIACMAPFVNWIKTNGYNGLVGEHGVPWATDASSWATVLDRSLAHLKTNGLSGTYWAGGLWMGAGGYPLSCQANSLTGADLPSMTMLRKYGGIVYETETVALVTSSGETVSIINENPLSQGKGEQFLANGAGDYITYTVPNVPAGTYNVFVRCKKYNSRGIFQLAIAGANGSGGYVNQGTAQNLYLNGTSYEVLSLGAKTFTTTGDKDFRFTVTGKSASATGYNLLIDYIQLQK